MWDLLIEDFEAPPRSLGFILQSAGIVQDINRKETLSDLHLGKLAIVCWQ